MSNWSNFFQQAVAGVESRLDNILAEDVEAVQVKGSPRFERKRGQSAPREKYASTGQYYVSADLIYRWKLTVHSASKEPIIREKEWTSSGTPGPCSGEPRGS